jgi:transcriptional regulator with XRE-family HTH domain
MTTPNDTLRAYRISRGYSQDDFALALQDAGARAGAPNDITKRTIQRWEAGKTASPRPVYARALQALTGLPIESLGFPSGADRVLLDDGRGGHDLAVRARPVHGDLRRRSTGDYSGIWLSTYEYYSSGRAQAYEGKHVAVLLQTGSRLTVRSLPRSADSTMTMDLRVDSNVVTGMWEEETSSSGYYRGARYFGAIQMVADPTGHRLSGKWTGFGKNLDVNSGPWSLTFLEAATTRVAIEEYNRPL